MKGRENKTVIKSGATALELLCIALIILKLIGLIKLSWWIVLAPIWIPFILCMLYVIVMVLIINKINKKK